MKQAELSPVLAAKLKKLHRLLQRTGGCAVAYSGGVDSSLLLAAARETLGDRCLAVIGLSPVNGRREQEAALAWLKQSRTPYVAVRTRELADRRFCANPENRCYFCKRGLFQLIRKTAVAHGLHQVAEGSNADDPKQIRPGRKAMEELGVLRPLEQAGLGKAEIRELARKVYRLPVAAKPSNPCLASRVAFGLRLTSARLRQVEAMENFLQAQGFRIFRARVHPGVLRIELGPGEEQRLLRPAVRRDCIAEARRLGFVQVTLDLQGFRSGSGHEGIRKR